MRFLFLSLVFLFFSFGIDADERNCDGSLQCFLTSFNLTIPNQLINSSAIEFALEDTNCSRISLGDIQSNTISNSLSAHIKGFNITCVGNMRVNQKSWPNISQNASFSLVLRDSEISSSLLIQYDESLQNATLKGCGAAVTIEDVELHGDIEPLFFLVRPIAIAFIESNAKTLICDQLESLVHTNLSLLLSDLKRESKEYTQKFKEEKLYRENPSIPPFKTLLNMQNYSYIKVVDYAANELIGLNGSANINTIMNLLTKQKGSIDIQDFGKFFSQFGLSLNQPSFQIPISGFGNITIGIDSVGARGLNSWDQFNILLPSSNLTLDSQTGMKRLGLSTEVKIDLNPETSSKLKEKIKFSVELEECHSESRIFMALNQNITKLVGNQFADLDCLSSQMDLVNLPGIFLNFTLKNVSIELDSQEKLESQINNLIYSASHFAINNILDSIPFLLQKMAIDPATEAANSALEDFTTESHTCPASEDPNAGTFNGKATVITSTVFSFLFILMLVVIIAVRRKREKEGEYENLISEYKNDITLEPSLIMDDRINVIIRYGILGYLLANICLFISSNTSVGASAFVFLTSEEGRVQLPSTFYFSLTNSVEDMWKAKVYALSIIIACFSGIWPYVKLVMMILSWIVPPRFLSTKRRETLLMVLDALGKWSLVDSYVLIMMMVAFNFHIVPDVTIFTAEGTFAVDVYVEPFWGFYSFLLATMLSLLITHVILHYHRKMKDSFGLQNRDEEEKKIPLWRQSTFGKSLNIQCLVFYGSAFLILCCTALVIVGAVIQTFDIQFVGLFRQLLNHLSQPTMRPFSLFTLGKSISAAALHPDSFGIRFIQITFFFFAFIIPMAYLVSLSVLWFFPLTKKMQSKLIVFTEVTHAWSALEVFVVSVVASLLQLEQFSQFMLGGKCDIINKVLESYASGILGDYPLCFGVIATLRSGCWLLFSSCLIYVVMGSVMMHFCHQAVESSDRKLINQSTEINNDE
eukprot:TRINITY_DN3992_c0_g2_i1.p1 TRINITY_DN3992_c0_g2~~TRINITY_DN3992_c0_g2_i1.p1  ORF type:complete len:982 (-),score=368.11 TRINITY_DN3992_c0_g2_i1:214-3159(-)